MPKAYLKKYFGHDKFRSPQEEIINAVLEKKDVLAVMPTGGGKSICYQLPALMMQGVTLVISPLIALMKDQVDTLKSKGISVEFLNSSLSEEEKEDIEIDLLNGNIKILYVSPERLGMINFQNFLKRINIELVAVDEAHCISGWGHEFRPSYRGLGVLKGLFPKASIIAVTATATPKVQSDIINQLHLVNANTFVSSFDRDNLDIIVQQKIMEDRVIEKLLIENSGGSAVIYCLSRKDTERIAGDLNDSGFSALAYHAGLNTKVRSKNQELFLSGKVQIVVATIAFGMGIDKADVRLVVHHTFPKSLEAYYQEIGRAGRDGKRSKCVLLYSDQDKSKYEYFIRQMSSAKARKLSSDKLNEIVEYCESEECRRKQILAHFGEAYKEDNCNSCDVCLGFDRLDSVRNVDCSKNADLVEILTDLRDKVAFSYLMPEFAIFSNITIAHMAERLPITKEELLEINGVSFLKCDKFGEDFIDAIKLYKGQSE